MKKQRTSASNAIAKYQTIAKIRNLRNGREPQGGRLQNEMPNTVNQGTNKTQITTQPVKCGKTCLYKNACPIAPMSNPQLVMLNVPIMQRRLTKKAEPPPTRGVNRDSGTEGANGGWLRRLVRHHWTILCHVSSNFQRTVNSPASARTIRPVSECGVTSVGLVLLFIVSTKCASLTSQVPVR